MKVNIRLSDTEVKRAIAEWLQNNTNYDVRDQDVVVFVEDEFKVAVEAHIVDRIVD